MVMNLQNSQHGLTRLLQMNKLSEYVLVVGIVALCALTFIIVPVIALRTFQDEKSVTLNTATFSDFAEYKKKLPLESEEVSLVAVGDIMLSRVVATKMKVAGTDFPFSALGGFLKDADLTFGNLESPITPGRQIWAQEMLFRTDPEMASVLAKYGFDVLSLANNHTPNFGQKGLLDTFSHLKENGIEYVGAGKNNEEAHAPVYIEKKGITFAFLAYNDSDVVPPEYEAGDTHAGTAFMRVSTMTQDVQHAKQKADIVIVSMHSGNEYEPSPNSSQTEFARAAIDAGAEMVMGHHPHVVQHMELYKDKYIFYSLGNFIFDQMQTQDVREGLMLKIFFTKEGVSRLYTHPVLIEDWARPRMLFGAEATTVLYRLGQLLYDAVSVVYSPPVPFLTQETTQQVQQKPFVEKQKQKSEEHNINNNETQETYTLEHGVLSVIENDATVFKTTSTWWVDDFALADVDQDQEIDLMFSVWKEGDFGSSKPFWVKENDMSVKNHFFVYEFKNNEWKPKWQSSNLEKPNCEFAVADIDADTKNDLVVIEGNYDDWPVCKGEYIAIWKWNGWGFSNEYRSGKMHVHNVRLESLAEFNAAIFADTY